MKSLLILCLLLASLHARADVVIVEDIQAGGQDQKMPSVKNITIKIKGNKVREDLNAGVALSVIVDSDTGGITTLLHSQKKFITLDTKALGEKVKEALGTGDSSKTSAPEIVDTGKQEKVGDYNTEIYTFETNKSKFTFWMTKDIPNYASIREQTQKLRGLLGKLGMGDLPDTSKIDGLAVKTEIAISDGAKTITVTLVSAKEEPVDDTEFQIPADYTKAVQPSPAASPTPAAAPSAAPAAPPQ